MSDTITIKLADKEYVIRRLTLRQSRAIGLGVARDVPTQPQENFAYAVDQAIEVIRVALSRDNPDVTADTILDLETGTKEIIEASRSILEFSGFIPAKAKPGEALPAAA